MDIPQQERFKILAIGDACYDIYQYGEVTRISPEAPVPVFVKKYEEYKNGMVLNVADNLRALGCDVDVIKADGKSVKIRMIDIHSKQHLIRIDTDPVVHPLTLQDDLKDIDLDQYHAIVISDYNKGAITYEFVQRLQCEFLGRPIFIDTKKRILSNFDGAIVKINLPEYHDIETANDRLVVTMGEHGAMYITEDRTISEEGCPVDVADVCGAGDTFLASLAYFYLLFYGDEGDDYEDMYYIMQCANRAASITVQHVGNYAPSFDEIFA